MTNGAVGLVRSAIFLIEFQHEYLNGRKVDILTVANNLFDSVFD